jgi:hypothetical protein
MWCLVFCMDLVFESNKPSNADLLKLLSVP